MRVAAAQPIVTDKPHGAGRMALDIGLSIGTGIAADQIRRSCLRSGSVPAALIGLAGGAAIKSLAKGTITAGENIAAGKPWTEGVVASMGDGLRTGAIDSGITVAAPAVTRRISLAFPKLSVVKLAGVSGLALGGAAGALDTASNRRTWQQGTASGLAAVGKGTLYGAVGGMILGGVTGHVANFFHARGTVKSITVEPTTNTNAIRGGLKTFKHLDLVQGSDIAGGGQPAFLLDLETPEMLTVRNAAKSIGDNPALSTTEKITAVHELVNSKLKFASRKTPSVYDVYAAVNKRFTGKSVPLGEYLKAGAADCRGFALLNQVLMQEAKVPTFYTYIQEFRGGRYIWDHAINVMFEGKTPTVLDSLFPNFDRMPLKQMLTAGKETIAGTVTFGAHQTLPFVFQNAAHNLRPLPGSLSALPHVWAAGSGTIAGVAENQP